MNKLISVSAIVASLFCSVACKYETNVTVKVDAQGSAEASNANSGNAAASSSANPSASASANPSANAGAVAGSNASADSGSTANSGSASNAVAPGSADAGTPTTAPVDVHTKLVITAGLVGAAQDYLMAQTSNVGIMPLTFCTFGGPVEFDGFDMDFRSLSEGGSWLGANGKPFVSNVRVMMGSTVLMGPVEFVDVGGHGEQGLIDVFRIPADACVSARIVADILSSADSPNVVGKDYSLSLTGFHSDADEVTIYGATQYVFRLISTATQL